MVAHEKSLYKLWTVPVWRPSLPFPVFFSKGKYFWSMVFKGIQKQNFKFNNATQKYFYIFSTKTPSEDLFCCTHFFEHPGKSVTSIIRLKKFELRRSSTLYSIVAILFIFRFMFSKTESLHNETTNNETCSHSTKLENKYLALSSNLSA